jgi:hypothetical protein
MSPITGNAEMETIAAPMSAAPFSGSISPVRAPTWAIVTTSGSVLERGQYLHDAMSRKEDSQGQGQGDEPGKWSPYQKGTDEDRQHRAEQSPDEARHIPRPEQGGESYESASQKQPARERFEHQRCDQRRGCGEKTEDDHDDPRNQE